MRRLLLFALLTTGLPTSAQTPAERSRMAQNVEALTERLGDARGVLDSIASGPDRDSARVAVRELEARLEAARDDLAEADDRRAAADEPETTAPRDEAGDRSSAEENDTTTEPPDTTEALDVPDDVGGVWYTNPLIYASLAALLALGGGAYWYAQRRDASAVRTSVRTSSSRLPPKGHEITEQGIASGTSPFVTPAQFDALTRKVEQQRRELEDLRKWITDDHARREALRATATLAPVVQAPASVALSPADAAAEAFADWCRRATPMMSKVDFFANALAERVPGTAVRAVYRDSYSQAEPVRFDGSGGASPAEFWLVTVGGEALVFPQPLNAHQFRDLTRIFEGTATPASLQSVVPARVRDEGAAFALVAPGRVSG